MLGRLLRACARPLRRWLSTTVVDSTLGDASRIESAATVVHCSVGHGVYIGPEARLFGAHIGPYASIGPRVTVGENEHEHKLFSTSDLLLDGLGRRAYEAHKLAVTEIGADVWIGCNAFVRKGVRIGVGAIVGAHAVVLKDVPPYAIVVGVPARVVSYRFTSHMRARLLESQWWLASRATLRAALDRQYGAGGLPMEQSEEQMLDFLAALGGADAPAHGGGH